jgi:hypothetical protein
MSNDEGFYREVRDSVPVFWIPPSSQLTGVLMFRAGRADESLLTGGLTHLVEHLALYTMERRQPYQFNGMVDGVRTFFFVTGSPEEVASFMNRLCEAIANLPLERIEAESRVLLAEAMGRISGPVEDSLLFRFGTTAHGQLALREYGLFAPDKAKVASWAAERFTAENAVACFSGPVPAGVSFAALPHGRRIPCPESFPIARLRTPAYLSYKPGGIVVSFVTERDARIGIPWQIAVTRLEELLRFRQGLTYSVQSAAQIVSAGRLHSSILIRCLDEHAPAVRDGLLEVLGSLAREGPTPDEMSRLRETFARSGTEPGASARYLDLVCMNELVGYPVKSWGTLLEDFQALSPDLVAESARSALETAMLMLPPGCPAPPDLFLPYPWSETTVKGARFRSADQRFPWSKKGRELIAGTEGVSLVYPRGEALTVKYDSCSGVILHPGGDLLVFGKDAVLLWIKPADWRSGRRACEEIVRSTPGELLKVVSS